MVKRKSRKSILYRPKGKGKGKAKGKAKARNGENANVSNWDKMHLFGAFSINDKDDDNLKYRFRRGDIATILPSHKTPGDSIEPHEYWVGKILEIRADHGGMDSEQIWTKVQWLYSAEEAKDLIPSLDTSLFGNFERIWSNHWDFVFPHAFNEVISLPRLLTFPRHSSPSSILQQPRPPCTPKPLVQQTLYQRGASLLSSSSTLTTITNTSTTTTSGDGGSSTTMTTMTSGADESTSGMASTTQDLTTQRVIGPDEFYWRYTLSVEERTLDPEPVSESNCICSNPYLPDEESLRGGVMIYCPRARCRTGYHLGCLEDMNCVWVEKVNGDDGGGDGEGNVVNIDVNVEETGDEEEEEEEEWLSKRAIRRISTPSDSNDAYIDLLSLLDSQPHKTKTQTSELTTKEETERGDGAGQVISLLERVYNRQLEQYYLYSQSESHSSQPHQKKRKKPHQLTSNSLLASLFILPPPFSPNPTSTLLSSKITRQRQRQRQRRQQCELHLLLAVASQPLIRGGGYFDELGPTGNVNAVICAREFVWEVVSRIGELGFGTLVREGEGEGGRGVGDGEQEEQERERERDEERKDREDFSRIRECVENVLDRFREKFFSLSKSDDNNNIPDGTTGTHSESNGMKDLVLPPDVSIEDAIVVKKGLLFFDYLHQSRKGGIPRTRTNSTATSDVDEDEDEDAEGEGDSDEEEIGMEYVIIKEEPQSDVDIVEETEEEGEDEDEDEDDANTSADEIDDILLSSSRKRKRSVGTMRRSGRRNRDQTRKKRRKGVVTMEFGEGGGDDNDGSNEEEEEEDSEDEMLLNVDWACPGCGGSI